MSHIFISYSKQNRSYAVQLAEHLIAQRFDVWIDDQIDYGTDWEDVIQQAIDDCAALVIIMTPQSEESRWVRTECEYAAQRHKPIFPILLAGDVFFRFISVQYVNVTDGALPPDAFIDELGQHVPRQPGKGQTITGTHKAASHAVGKASLSAEPNSTHDVSQSIGSSSRVNRSPNQSHLRSAGLIAALVFILATGLYLVSRNQPGDEQPLTAASASPVWVAEITEMLETPLLLSPSPIAPITANSSWQPIIQSVNGVDMALVPPGCFTMGSETGDSDEQPLTQQCFDAPFWIGVSEVTNAAYLECVVDNGCSAPQEADGYDDPAMGLYPIVNVTWQQADEYASWRGGRLPTEAEWEYTAKGPDGLIYPWGNEFDPDQLNFCDVNCSAEWSDGGYDDAFPETAPVASFAGNSSWVGALDMSGNVREWTSTVYRLYPYRSNAINNADAARNNGWVTRGGSWYSVDSHNRTTKRFASDQTGYTNELGFRIAMDSDD